MAEAKLTKREWDGLELAVRVAADCDLTADERASLREARDMLRRFKPSHEPTLDDLIDRWWADPTPKNHSAAWAALNRVLGQKWFYRHGGTMAIRAQEKGGFEIRPMGNA